MSRLNVGNLYNENEDGAPAVSGISTFSSPHYFVPPSGSTQERPQNPSEGMIRFNTDSGHLDYYSGELWVDVITNNNELGNHLVTNSAGGTGTRGVWSGGRVNPSGGYSDVMDYITIETLGDAQDFGDLAAARAYIAGGCASGTKGILYGGANGPMVNTIDKFVFASTGSRSDFDETVGSDAGNAGAVSDGTRGVFGGIASPNWTTRIDYITIESDGSAADFGDTLVSCYEMAGCSSKVRGLFGAPYRSPGAYVNAIEYITIPSTGNSLDFGDLTAARRIASSLSNSTRGVWSGGLNPGTNVIDFVNIASTGNALDFGDLSANRFGNNGGASNATRGVWGGGYSGSGDRTALMESIQIMSTGNAASFGDLTVIRGYVAACSNGHGGL